MPLLSRRLGVTGPGRNTSGATLFRQDTRRPNVQSLPRLPTVVRPVPRTAPDIKDFPISPLTAQQIRFILGCDEDESLQPEVGSTSGDGPLENGNRDKESTVHQFELTSSMLST